MPKKFEETTTVTATEKPNDADEFSGNLLPITSKTENSEASTLTTEAKNITNKEKEQSNIEVPISETTEKSEASASTLVAKEVTNKDEKKRLNRCRLPITRINKKYEVSLSPEKMKMSCKVRYSLEKVTEFSQELEQWLIDRNEMTARDARTSQLKDLPECSTSSEIIDNFSQENIRINTFEDFYREFGVLSNIMKTQMSESATAATTLTESLKKNILSDMYKKLDPEMEMRLNSIGNRTSTWRETTSEKIPMFPGPCAAAPCTTNAYPNNAYPNHAQIPAFIHHPVPPLCVQDPGFYQNFQYSPAQILHYHLVNRAEINYSQYQKPEYFRQVQKEEEEKCPVQDFFQAMYSRTMKLPEHAQTRIIHSLFHTIAQEESTFSFTNF